MIDEEILNLTVREFLEEYYALYDGWHTEPVGLIHKSQKGIVEEFIKQYYPDSEIQLNDAIPMIEYLEVLSKDKIADFLKDEKINLGL